MSKLTPEQQTACAELLNRAANVNSFDDAARIVEILASLTERGIKAPDIMRWLTMLPRVRDRATALAEAELPPTPKLPKLETLPRQMQDSLRPPLGQSKKRPAEWLLDPDAKSTARPGKPTGWVARKAHRRPPTGTCETCQVEFPMNSHGRPAKNCADHRQSARKAS